jgi:hypothetical protein
LSVKNIGSSQRISEQTLWNWRDKVLADGAALFVLSKKNVSKKGAISVFVL